MSFKLFFAPIASHRSKQYSFPLRADNLAAVELVLLQANGIKGAILDLDNTIISEDDRYLSPGAEAWIETAKQAGFKFFLLSNGKRRHRVKYWSNRLNIPAIAPARKPFRGSFRQALVRMQLRPQQAIVIGDSVHTDILGAWLIGCPSIQVATLPHPCRWWEKLCGKYVQIPYPSHRQLWEFQPTNDCEFR
jgi:hypothetical protein